MEFCRNAFIVSENSRYEDKLINREIKSLCHTEMYIFVLSSRPFASINPANTNLVTVTQLLIIYIYNFLFNNVTVT